MNEQLVDRLEAWIASFPHSAPLRIDIEAAIAALRERSAAPGKVIGATESAVEAAVMPEPGHCACKFSGGGVLKSLCGWHTALIDAKERAEREACAKVAAEMERRCEVECRNSDAVCRSGGIPRAIRARGGKP